jgi:short subunit dehydrogenase-like uncharacterized protein
MAERDFDVVVFGATGVTGRRVAAYLAERAADGRLRWAAAGRDAGKVASVLAELGVKAPDTLSADIQDPASLAAMARRTTVVLDLVGPYALYGRPVIEACIAEGAHYVDLTGEMPFVKTVIEELDAPARSAGVKIVQVCGFEALPPDLLVLMAAEGARERWGEELDTVDLEVTFTPPPGLPRPSDGMSGGTFQSVANLAASEDSASITDPSILITDVGVAAAVRRLSPIGLAPRTGSTGAVIAPMAPAPFINPAVIHRTAALTAARDGRAPHPFRYREGLALGGAAATLPLRWAVAGALSASQIGLRGLARARPQIRIPVAGALVRFGPSSGFGPAADRIENWHWAMTAIARTASGNELRTRVRAEGHPGYLATARMLGEAGILLSEPGMTPDAAGCLTPGAALGTAHVGRFEMARAEFSFLD